MSKEPVAKTEPVKEAASWDDKLAAALPQKASFFDAMRTKPFMNLNVVANYVEFWSAFQVNATDDKWTVMHYMVYALDQDDGKFIAKPVAKEVTFPEAVFQLSRAEYTGEKMLTQVDFNMAERYPPQIYPELKAHFYDLEHFKKAANIEGIAFDEYNQPYRKIQGKIFADATFKRSEVVKSILSVEQARDNDNVRLRVEGGILADVFNTTVNPVASLDDKLKIGQVLSIMDNFTIHMAAYYLALQKALKLDEKLDKVAWLSPEDRTDILKRARDVAWNVEANNAYREITTGILPQAQNLLKQAEGLGVHVEPFRKHAAECELFINLVNAAQNVAKMDKALINANNTDIGLISQIRESVDKAQTQFLNLGGTQEQMDKLKAWISAFAREESDPARQKAVNQKMIPDWIPRFMSRYYEKRSGILEKVQKRTAGIRQVNTMSEEVKPGISNQYNQSSEPQPGAESKIPVTAAPGTAYGNDDEGKVIEKYKNLEDTGSKNSAPKI